MTLSRRARDKQVMFYLSDDEKKMLAAVAERRGLNLSDWLRQSIRDAFERIQPASRSGEAA